MTDDTTPPSDDEHEELVRRTALIMFLTERGAALTADMPRRDQCEEPDE